MWAKRIDCAKSLRVQILISALLIPVFLLKSGIWGAKPHPISITTLLIQENSLAFSGVKYKVFLSSFPMPVAGQL
jgi:hypothetical protein